MSQKVKRVSRKKKRNSVWVLEQLIGKQYKPTRVEIHRAHLDQVIAAGIDLGLKVKERVTEYRAVR